MTLNCLCAMRIATLKKLCLLAFLCVLSMLVVRSYFYTLVSPWKFLLFYYMPGFPSTYAEFYGLGRQDVYFMSPSEYPNIHQESTFKGQRILCWVSTYPAKMKLAMKTRDSWGKECDKFIISTVSNQMDDEQPRKGVMKFNLNPNYYHLWARTQATLKKIWEIYGSSYDFILKGDDDTFVFLPQLRKFLSRFDPSDSTFIGHPLSLKPFGSWMSGGSGYIMTAAAFQDVMVAIFQNEKRLENDEGLKALMDSSISEDVAMALLMANVSASFVATVDKYNKHMMIPIKLDEMLEDRPLKWYIQARIFGYKCCSEELISIHYNTEESFEIISKWRKNNPHDTDTLKAAKLILQDSQIY